MPEELGMAIRSKPSMPLIADSKELQKIVDPSNRTKASAFLAQGQPP